MRTLQSTLDAILDAGLYNPCVGHMCNSAQGGGAVSRKIVTQAECDALVLSIGLYIANVTGEPASMTTMRYTYWRTTGRTWRKASSEELLNLYRNWTNRPRWNRAMRMDSLA